jgi:CheY-like chemotaxis protein
LNRLNRPGCGIVAGQAQSFIERAVAFMPNVSRLQILVVDDEEGIRSSLRLLLMTVGYDVAVAENGIKAVSQLSESAPDLIVTDLNMPGMSGMELISHVRDRYPSIRIVAMSGAYQAETVPKSLPADKFWAKGQPFDGLLTTIAALVAMKPGRESDYESRSRLELDS